MDSAQTGFTSSSPTTASSSDGTDGAGRVSPPTPGVNRPQVKEEPKDVRVSTSTGVLPSISEENWRSYYQHSLVTGTATTVMNGTEDHATAVSTIYETYKLPPLAKFGKGLVGKMPAIWSVAVTSPEASSLLSPADGSVTPGSPVRSPSSQPSDLSSTTIYLRESPVKPDPEDARSVIQQVPDTEAGKSTATDEKEAPGQTLPLAPAAVEVKQPDTESSTDLSSDPAQARDMQAETSQADLPLEGATYPSAEFSPSPYEPLGTGQYSVLTNVVVTAAPPQYGAQSSAVYTLAPGDYYREYYSATDQYQAVRQHLASYPEGVDNAAYVERYIRQNYKPSPHGLTVDLPSPDSGIGEATVTPRDTLQQIFDYSELTQAQPLLQSAEEQATTAATGNTPSTSPPPRKPSWSQEYGRNADSDKVQIPKLYSEVGFHYYLETPISTSQRREDDRMTYINKGQYYGITLEYIPDPDRPLRTSTVKSIVLLVFREEKSPEDELKAWKFWHGRQHSVKQRILDADPDVLDRVATVSSTIEGKFIKYAHTRGKALNSSLNSKDTKNSCGIIGQIDEVAHNAIAFYWNPMEGPAKISVSVHCLSTDFSNQKGVKGLPLHIQIDTLDDFRGGVMPVHRGYCQIKVFCDKGAERKTRDEERRAAKRKLTASGNSRKKIEEMYHPSCERSEFYTMSDMSKPPVLFTPTDDTEKSNGPELTFYTIAPSVAEDISSVGEVDVKPPTEMAVLPVKRFKLSPSERELTMSYWGSVLLYAKRADEEVFHPLHLVPPSLAGLAKAIETKYNISSESIRNMYKRCKKGITVEMDDDIVRHYCNEDTFIIDIIKTEDEKYDVTLVEL